MTDSMQRDPLDMLADAASAQSIAGTSGQDIERMVTHALIVANARHRRSDRMRLAMAYASAALVLLAIGIGVWLPRRADEATSLASNDRTRLTLPTGDRLVSTADAQLDLGDFTAQHRTIRVSHGTVLFDVARLPTESPFIVEAPDLRAIVRGTVFSVTVERNASRVHVFEGHVDVERSDGTHSLLAGQQISSRLQNDVPHVAVLQSEGEWTARERSRHRLVGRAVVVEREPLRSDAASSTEIVAPNRVPLVQAPSRSTSATSQEANARTTSTEAATVLLGEQRYDEALALAARADENDGAWLMIRADALRGLARMAEAADVYDRAAAHLSPSRAVVAGFSAARLRFERMNDAQGTLRSLDSSHADESGSSVEEAAFVLRLRAFESLNRDDDLERAGRLYLARFPDGHARSWIDAWLSARAR